LLNVRPAVIGNTEVSVAMHVSRQNADGGSAMPKFRRFLLFAAVTALVLSSTRGISFAQTMTPKPTAPDKY
jgi:hypothetical protein